MVGKSVFTHLRIEVSTGPEDGERALMVGVGLGPVLTTLESEFDSYKEITERRSC